MFRNNDRLTHRLALARQIPHARQTTLVSRSYHHRRSGIERVIGVGPIFVANVARRLQAVRLIETSRPKCRRRL